MSMTSLRCLVGVATIATAWFVGSCGPTGNDSDRTPVELWAVGDDALTLSLRDAVERAIEASPSLRMDDTRPPVLVITIPSNVKWRSEAGRTTITYSVEYARPNGSQVDVGTGSCLKENTPQCAEAIVRKAEKIVSEGRSRPN
jgi:hypothetical protein